MIRILIGSLVGGLAQFFVGFIFWGLPFLSRIPFTVAPDPQNAAVQTALAHDLHIGDPPAMPFEIRAHARYNPAAESRLNIVPGLVGTILTMTMLIFTALSVTREIERGTMESLLSMPIRPVEIMLGKIVPYIIVGFIQAALILSIGILLFGVPLLGSLVLLAMLSTLFITANLAIGYTFSTLAQNQLQAVQMAMMFFLPNMLMSGFLFPFAGMPVWAQWVGEFMPLTHYVRIVRSIMLKGATLLSVIGLADMFYTAKLVAVNEFKPFELYTAAAVLVIIVTLVAALAAGVAERRLSKGVRR